MHPAGDPIFLGDETVRLLAAGAAQWGIDLSPNALGQFAAYRDLLIDWNENRMNLTRLTSPADIAIEHFLDSLSLLTCVRIAPAASLLDIGAGPGFPSLPLKIARPDLKITLLEATAKKLEFCRAVADSLGLDRVRFIHARAELHPKAMTEQFDVVTARAVAPLGKLVPMCAPFMTKKGVIAAWKGSRVADEIDEAGDALKRVGLVAELHTIDVPGSVRTHAIVVCRRV